MPMCGRKDAGMGEGESTSVGEEGEHMGNVALEGARIVVGADDGEETEVVDIVKATREIGISKATVHDALGR